MRKFIFIASIVFGVGGGLLMTAEERWATKFAAVGVALMFCVPIGAALAGYGRPHSSDQLRRWPADWDDPQEIAENYWRDEGNAPHTAPVFKGAPDQHMHDSDKSI